MQARFARAGRASRWRQIRTSLDAGQWRTVAMMAAVVLGLHAIGFFLLIALVAPHHYHLGTTGAFAVGTGVTAYTLGLRHAFGADHISAIDNTTRKLMADGKRPMSVGFFFSLGHSTIAFMFAFLWRWVGALAAAVYVSLPFGLLLWGTRPATVRA